MKKTHHVAIAVTAAIVVASGGYLATTQHKTTPIKVTREQDSLAKVISAGDTAMYNRMLESFQEDNKDTLRKKLTSP